MLSNDTVKARLAKSRGVQDRLAATPLQPTSWADEQGHGAQAAAEQRKRLRREPGVERAGPGEAKQHGHDAHDQQQRAQQVEPWPGVGVPERRHDGHQRQEGRHAEREIDVEDEAPGRMVGDPAAQDGAEDRGDTDDRHQPSLPPGALLRREEVGEGGHRYRHDAARADALEGAEQNELVHGLGHAAQGRSQGEDRQAAQEDRLAADQVRQLAVDGDQYRRGQHVGGSNPGVAVEAVEHADDARHRRADDSAVQRGHQQGQQEAGQGQQHLAARVGRAVRRGRAGRRGVGRHR